MSRSRMLVRGALALLAAGVAACQEGVSSSGGGPRLELVSRDSQTVLVGERLIPVVRATYGGRPLPNIEISWVGDGNADVDARTRTDASGMATAQWYLGTRPGLYHLAVSGAGPDELRVTATAIAGAFTIFRLRPDSGVLASVADSVQLAAVGTDRYGNVVPTPAVTWQSLDPGVATVGSTGMVRGRVGGIARVVASAAPYADTARIRVEQHAYTLRVTPRADTIASLNGTTTLAARVRDVHGNDMPQAPVTWSALDPSVVRVNASGVATGIMNGLGRVVARSEQAADTVPVTVKQVIYIIRMKPSNATLEAGDTVRIVPTGYDYLGSPTPAFKQYWLSQEPAIATVDSTGLVQAVAPGEVLVQVSTGTLFGYTLITVIAPTP